ncbi:Acyl-homoserine lactone (AHL) acylase PvdQ [Halanaeroarchaeum sp. HSR-CO]|uniref:penicillin acylase family protein n=1 Tax=Halanaeroarchaeum sp. HSR-CO TaxID=2866382 RepID=UPI00217D64CC|nr:penicillin acylase family protein [Halanaeroarchaeum sp. HSR-CO]UWG47533.1 Acyl-homoserine lactone (AHL) acylase PvdQ [Halanaeroarchaeum sp. HSR-CO]
MPRETTRRRVLAGILGAGVGGLTLSSASDLLDQFAPLSGGLWDAADRELPSTVESPHGNATLQVDDYGVPHIDAASERAAYFAVGYVQAFDRLFQMDLQRRVMGGRLSEVVGEATLESDEFHVAMDFTGAAEATWDLIQAGPVGPLVEAFADGVDASMQSDQLPLEFELLEYEPRRWTPVDTMLMEKQISWGLTGNFGALRRAVLADRLGSELVQELFPERLDHDVPILRDELDTTRNQGSMDATIRNLDEASKTADSEAVTGGKALIDWLSMFESAPGIGSNSWVVSGDHTATGSPLLAYDPHLELMVPPVWYEQHVETPENSVRGVTFPGVPFVIAGRNGYGVWSFTNVGADVLDVYDYEIDEDGERYRYEGEWRDFDTERRKIRVSDGEDRSRTIRKTVHGPVLEREGRRVGVAWTGHSATRTTEAIYEFGHNEGLDAMLESTKKFDLPTQNLVYADADGRTMYYATGKLPRRRIDGEVVPGNRIFDGSAGAGEWEGFTPFGESTWEGFVPFDEKPHAIDPAVLATANQRVVDDPRHYIGTAYSTPYRGARIYERLEERLESGGPMDLSFFQDLQTDVYDGRAADLVPELVDATTGTDLSSKATAAVDALDDWNYLMERDSYAALVFARWIDAFVEATVEPTFSEADLDDSYYPSDWVVAKLSPDSPLYEDRSRKDTMVDSLRTALQEIEENGWSTYGDWNTTRAVSHPLGSEAGFLNYREEPMGGSPVTVKNFRVEDDVGSSWRMIVTPGGDAGSVLPGGNSGDYFSSHFDDQLDLWIEGELKPMRRTHDGDIRVAFEEGSS